MLLFRLRRLLTDPSHARFALSWRLLALRDALRGDAVLPPTVPLPDPTAARIDDLPPVTVAAPTRAEPPPTPPEDVFTPVPVEIPPPPEGVPGPSEGQRLLDAFENRPLGSLDRLILRNVAGKLGLPPFYPGQPDPETLALAVSALDAVGERGVADAGGVVLSHIMDLYLASRESPHVGLNAKPGDRDDLLALFAQHTTVAQPLFLATRHLLARQYAGVVLRDAALDLGNGSGDTSKSILGERKLCIGSTPIIDENMGARHHFGSHRHYMAIDAAAIPFEADTFATVSMNYTFYHLEQPRLSCREVFRVLQPGGLFAFNFLKRDAVTETRVMPAMLGRLGLTDHERRAGDFVFVDYGAEAGTLDLQAALAMLGDAGFGDISVTEYLSRPLSRLIWLVRDYEIVLGQSAILSVANPVLAERYRRFCEEVLAPMISNDKDLCEREGGTFAFVTARKPGEPPAPLDDETVLARLRCPRTGAKLRDRGGWLEGGDVYPVLSGIPLTIPIYADIWAEQYPGVEPSERGEFKYLKYPL